MTRFNLALIASVAIAAISVFAQPAAAIEYPWCAEYGAGTDGGGRNCGFSTLEQCRETISGMGGSCEPNLFYAAPAEQPARRARKRNRD